ncbi:MAG TPA: hypothetical protein VNB22_10215 [Pyrinomonadaceae bacterium]|nr:hypothetical protein [Pyrinomonadaceae bacterium]
MIFRILQIAIPFIWFGAVCAISFMEAPLKFTAPNITIPLGLGIGMIIFHTLNKIEIVLCVLLALSFFAARPKWKFQFGAFALIALVLIIQTFVLFPMLDERAVQVISGNAPPFSSLHIVYIISDSIKVLLLFILGVSLLRKSIKFE